MLKFIFTIILLFILFYNSYCQSVYQAYHDIDWKLQEINDKLGETQNKFEKERNLKVNDLLIKDSLNISNFKGINYLSTKVLYSIDTLISKSVIIIEEHGLDYNDNTFYQETTELKQNFKKLESYINDSINYLSDTVKSEIVEVLKTEDNNSSVSWESQNFEYLPAIAIKTVLEQMKSNIYHIEITIADEIYRVFPIKYD